MLREQAQREEDGHGDQDRADVPVVLSAEASAAL